MKEKLKNVYLRVEDGAWVSPTTVKCMCTEFVRKSVNRTGMPSSISGALAFLIKRGYIEIHPTQAGRKFADRFMRLYEQRERKQADATKVRRQMRHTALKGTFCLDKVAPSEYPRDSNVVICGHYDDVRVTVSSIYKYIKLKKGHIESYVDKGKLYDKIITDVSTVLMSPEGKLWLLKVGVSQLKWFVNWYNWYKSHKTTR